MLQIKLSILSYLPINVLLLREKLTDSLPSYLGVQNLTYKLLLDCMGHSSLSY